jgi:UDP-N-acetylmuramyl pentapeptide phosphotransferase/UDP-N-acetylglucosamine-1-phosphate transferase
LIDGIDGLSGMLGVLIFSIFGAFFYFSAHYFYFLLSVLGIGFLLAFLRFNLSKKDKIFMGDTGSLIIGFLIAIMTIRFLTMSEFEYNRIMIDPGYKFFIVLSVLFFPIIDVARVIVMRLLNKRGPFDPDRSHMHHILVDKGLKHKTASITMTICGLIIFSLLYLLNINLSALGFTFVFICLTFMTFTILLLLDSNQHASIYRKKFKRFFPRPIQVLEFRIRKMIIFVMKRLFYRNLL